MSEKTIVTHDGKFHADDVFAVATALLLEPNLKIVRTRDHNEISAGTIVVDVGGVYDAEKDRFDHHQLEPVAVRENGIMYAAFGLIWKHLGEELCGSEKVAKRVDDVLVVSVDANDNGIDLSVPRSPNQSAYEISDAIRSFIPTWQEKELSFTDSFMEAVVLAKRLIEREIRRAKAFVAGEQNVEEVYRNAKDKRLIVLSDDYSWKDILSKFPEPIYVVHPQGETWRVYAVRDNPHLFTNRKDMPEEWAGLRDEALARVTGVSDAIFAHRNRFLAVARTREGAIALAEQALNS